MCIRDRTGTVPLGEASSIDCGLSLSNTSLSSHLVLDSIKDILVLMAYGHLLNEYKTG